MTAPIRLYLSASIANTPLNLRLRDHLPAPRYELILPQEFTPDVPHPQLPRAIYDRCIAEMDRCDAGLLLLDAYGIDCAAEAGWFAARKKAFVGVAFASTRFLQNWMVKGALTAVICLDADVLVAVREDPILGSARIEHAAGWPQLSDALARVLAESSTGGPIR